MGLGLPERALAEARSGTFSAFSGCDAGDRDGLRSGRPRGVVVRALGDDDDDEGVPGGEGGERAAAATATVEGLPAAFARCPRPDARGLPGMTTELFFLILESFVANSRRNHARLWTFKQASNYLLVDFDSLNPDT